MGVAKTVPTHQKGEAGSETVVNENATVAGNQAHSLHCLDAAFGIKMVGCQFFGPENVQPMALAVDGATGLIPAPTRPLRTAIGLTMSLRSIHRHGQRDFAQGPRGWAPWRWPLSASPLDDVSEGAFAKGGFKKLAKECAQTSVRKELVSAEIVGGGLHARTVLHGGFDLFWEELR